MNLLSRIWAWIQGKTPNKPDVKMFQSEIKAQDSRLHAWGPFCTQHVYIPRKVLELEGGGFSKKFRYFLGENCVWCKMKDKEYQSKMTRHFSRRSCNLSPRRRKNFNNSRRTHPAKLAQLMRQRQVSVAQ